MNFLCRVVGHKPPVYAKKGWWSPGEEYAKVCGERTDGIGRVHAEVHAECARCEEAFKICRIHIPKEKVPVAIGKVIAAGDGGSK